MSRFAASIRRCEKGQPAATTSGRHFLSGAVWPPRFNVEQEQPKTTAAALQAAREADGLAAQQARPSCTDQDAAAAATAGEAATDCAVTIQPQHDEELDERRRQQQPHQ